MINTLKNILNNWYEQSGLQGFYLVGSRSLHEENAFSDVDLFGLTVDRLTFENISILRQGLKEELKDIIPADKIGFRIRTIKELPLFQSKLKSWGYDLLYSQHIYGIELNSLLPKTNTTGFSQQLVFNNMIELLWYNQLCLNNTTNQQFKNYTCAKSILNVLSFILYHNEIFIPTTKGRITYIESNINLIDSLSITLEDIHESFKARNYPNNYKSQIDFDRLRNDLIKETYINFLPAFENIKSEFTSHDYWNYDSSSLNSLNSICDRTNKKITDYKYSYFNWRVVLMEELIKLDSVRLNNPDIMLSATKELIALLIKKESVNINEIKNETSLDILLKLENLRLKVSEFGRDSSRKIN
jgi:hypothetical protein